MNDLRKLVLVLFLGGASSAHAGGVFIGEPGAQAMERGGAFVAKADDLSALGGNPAGLAKAGRFDFYLGGSVVDHSLTFKRAGVYAQQPDETVQPEYTADPNNPTPYPEVEDEASAQPLPLLAASQRWKNLVVAEGILAPESSPSREFPCQIADNCVVDGSGAPAPARYDLVNQTVFVLLPSVGLAYRVHDMLDVGVRASWGFGSIQARTFTWGVGNPEGDPNKDGDFRIDVSDGFIPGWSAGVLFRPVDFLEFGLAYSSKLEFRGKGTGTVHLGPMLANPGGGTLTTIIGPVDDSEAACAPGGTAAQLKTCLSLDVPQTLTWGGRFILRGPGGIERGDLEVDGRWENWGNASDITVVVDGQSLTNGMCAGNCLLKPTLIRHGFEDTFAVRVGGSWRFPLAAGEQAVLARAGWAYDTAAAPTSWTRADIDGQPRMTFAGGVAYEMPRYRFELGAAYIHDTTRTVTDVLNPTTPPPMADRVQPDPLQPLKKSNAQDYGPFNAGTYKGSYFVGMASVSVSL